MYYNDHELNEIRSRQKNMKRKTNRQKRKAINQFFQADKFLKQ